MKEILARIRRADGCEIDDILETAIARKRELYPDWALLYAAGRKDNPDEWVDILTFLRAHGPEYIKDMIMIPEEYRGRAPKAL